MASLQRLSDATESVYECLLRLQRSLDEDEPLSGDVQTVQVLSNEHRVCLSVCLSVRPSVCPSVCLSLRLSVCLSVRPSVRLSVCFVVPPSVCLSVCPFKCCPTNTECVYVSVCLRVCLMMIIIMMIIVIINSDHNSITLSGCQILKQS